MEVGEGVRHGGRDRGHGQEAGEQLRGPHCAASGLNSTRGCGSRACEKAEGCGAEMWCGAGSATRACWRRRVNKQRDGLRELVEGPFSYQKRATGEGRRGRGASEGKVRRGREGLNVRTCWRKGWLVHTGGVPSEAYMN